VDRRAILALLGAAAAAPGLQAQEPGRHYRIGFFYYGSRRSALESGRYDVFRNELASLGYIEGKNLVIDAHYAEGRIERLASAASDMVRAKVDVIVATGGPPTRAARDATASIPIIITVTFDPVGEGFVTSLARPGGNITGISGLASDLLAKHLELLSLCVPSLRRMAVLTKPDNPSHQKFAAVIEQAGRRASVRVIMATARSAPEIDASFAAMTRERVQALAILAETFFVQQMRQIAALAEQHNLPSIYLTREYPEAGGMMSYGPDLTENFRRAAHFVDKVLRGARAGDLPIEQPTKVELVVNMKTARAVGATIPQSLLLRADRVID
jgi:putative tryptophan/tyrosine transport system substrate-binding protein